LDNEVTKWILPRKQENWASLWQEIIKRFVTKEKYKQPMLSPPYGVRNYPIAQAGIGKKGRKYGCQAGQPGKQSEGLYIEVPLAFVAGFL